MQQASGAPSTTTYQPNKPDQDERTMMSFQPIKPENQKFYETYGEDSDDAWIEEVTL